MKHTLRNALFSLALSATTAVWLWIFVGPTQSDIDMSVTGTAFAEQKSISAVDRQTPIQRFGDDELARSEPVSASAFVPGSFNFVVASGAVTGGSQQNSFATSSTDRAGSPVENPINPRFFAGSFGGSGGAGVGGGGGGGGGGAGGGAGPASFDGRSPTVPIELRSNDALTPAVPELSTWAMMIVGFAAIALMAYRRRNNARLAD